MKLQDELNNVIERFRAMADRIPPYAAELKASGDYKDFETRLAWDCLRSAMGTKWICSMYDKYQCNDTHLTTLAKKALAAVYKV
jgi:hypothetical protein